MIAQDLTPGQIIFFGKTEEVWNRPYVKKRHHSYDTRRVILRGVVISVNGKEFKAKLKDNNGFERDGEEYVFHEGCLLCNQDYKDLANLGKWEYSDQND